MENKLDSFIENNNFYDMTSENNQDITSEEYEKYKKYLMIRKECPSCHFIQGLIFSGIGFFCFVRIHHFKSLMTRKDIFRLFSIGSPSIGFGIYKFSYVNYIIGVQKQLDDFNKILHE